MHLLCDARSTPPRMAAVHECVHLFKGMLMCLCVVGLQVLVADGRMEHADAEPCDEVMKQFVRR